MLDHTVELFSYQLEGAAFLASKRFALLADEMGVGKTPQAIRATDIIEAKRVLVICPAVARPQWKTEFERFSLSKSHVYFTLNDTTTPPPPETTVVIASYSTTAAIPKSLKFDAMILDEGHFLKNPTAERTQLVLGKNGLIKQTKHVWFLTGTPISNHVNDLWLLFFLAKKTTLSFDEFTRKYCYGYVFQGKWRPKGTRDELNHEIRDMLSQIMLRRTKEDTMETKKLPRIDFLNLSIDPSPVDFGVSETYQDWFFPDDRTDELKAHLLDTDKTIKKLFALSDKPESRKLLNTIATLQNLESVARYRQFCGLQKVDGMVEVLNKALSFRQIKPKKIVVFAIHRSVIASLMNHPGLKKWSPVSLYGQTPLAKRERNITHFQANPNCRIFIGQIQACGSAINLTAANEVYFLEQSWSPADNLQAVMRVHRIGQTRECFVYNISAPGSVDEQISRALMRKLSSMFDIFNFQRQKAAIPFQPGQLINDRRRKLILEKPLDEKTIAEESPDNDGRVGEDGLKDLLS